MRHGKFEVDGSNDEPRSYRLHWETADQPAAVPLTHTEQLGGMFVRYLIERGKIDEFHDRGPLASD